MCLPENAENAAHRLNVKSARRHGWKIVPETQLRAMASNALTDAAGYICPGGSVESASQLTGEMRHALAAPLRKETNMNPETDTANAPIGALPLATGSAVFDGHIYKHPLHRAIYELCQEIEKLPASELETKCVVAAGELQNHVFAMRACAGLHAGCLRRYAAECFPEITNGQKHFVRVLMESIADDLDENFNPPNVIKDEPRESLARLLRSRRRDNE